MLGQIGEIVLPPTPGQAIGPSQIFSSLCVWTRAAEQAVRKLARFVDSITKFLDSTNAVYSGTGAPNSVQVGSIGDMYNQIASGALIKQWVKVTGNATNTGWS